MSIVISFQLIINVMFNITPGLEIMRHNNFNLNFIMTCVNSSIRIFVQHVFYIFNFYFIYVNSKLNYLWLIFNFKTSSNGQVNPNNKKGHKGKHKHSRFASFQKTRQRMEGQSDIVTTWAGHRS